MKRVHSSKYQLANWFIEALINYSNYEMDISEPIHLIKKNWYLGELPHKSFAMKIWKVGAGQNKVLAYYKIKKIDPANIIEERSMLTCHWYSRV